MPASSPSSSSTTTSTTSRNSSSPPASKQEQPQCHTCRKRRIRCDATQPSCKKCAAKNLTCPGYAKQKPLVWLADGGRQNQYIRADAQGGVPGGRKRGRPKVEVAKEQTEKKLTDTKGKKDMAMVRRPKENSIPETLDMAYPDDIKRVVRTLWYFDEKLFPDLYPIVLRPSAHTLDRNSWQENRHFVLWDILDSVVATHKTVQSQPPLPLTYHTEHNDTSDDGPIEVGLEVYQSRSRACRSLNEELRKPETQFSDVTLICVLTLLLAECQLSALGDWEAHFEGASQIIQLRGGLPAVFKQNPYINSVLTYYFLADVMTGTTTSSLSLVEAERQLESRELIPDLFADGAESCVPCPNDLFDAIIQINYIRASFSPVDFTESGSDSSAFKSRVRDLLQSILSFSISTWATQMSHRYNEKTQGPEITEENGFIQPTWDDWLQIGSVYHAAVLLYCIRSLALDFDEVLCVPCPNPSPQNQDRNGDGGQTIMSSYVTVHDIQLVAKQTLIDHIRAIFSPPKPKSRKSSDTINKPHCARLGKVIIWPLTVAGIEAAVDTSSCSTNEPLDLVCWAQHQLSRQLGTLNLRDASAFLRQEWRGNCARRRQQMTQWGVQLEEKRWWSEIFAGVPGRCCFFV